MNLFIILLFVVLVIIYVWSNSKDYFNVGYDPEFLYQEPVNYNTREQNCNQLTFSPTECVVDTVIPENKIVCTESLTPITNNDKDCGVKNRQDRQDKQDRKNTQNPTLSLINDFDLLSNFNNSQINNDNMVNDELESLYDLKTDVKSLASLENDNITNY